MNIAKKLGLEDEIFCRMVITTKMLLSNVLGHAAELHYEKYLRKEGIAVEKAPTDKHHDYTVKGRRDQVKRFESSSTNNKFIGVNLTKTHGNRIGPGGCYQRTDFDTLVVYDVDFGEPYFVDCASIAQNLKYSDRLPSKIKIERSVTKKLEDFPSRFLDVMKFKNSFFPDAIEKLRKEEGCDYKKLLEKVCNLTLEEIDSLFSEDNFRLVVGAKGFAAEEHFSVLLDKSKIPYKQMRDMYSKVDHLVRDLVKVQVKTLHGRSTDEKHWGIKTHKSHGSGVSELYKADEFEVVAIFVGNEMSEDSKYFPKSVSEKFILVPVSDLERHPKHPDHLKRVSKIVKDRYIINDLSLLK